MAGVFPPEMESLQFEEPERQHAERHVVVPADPGADLVMREADLALRTSEHLFDLVPAAGGADEFAKRRRLPRGVGEAEAPLGNLVERPDYEQPLPWPDAPVPPGLHVDDDRFLEDRAAFAVADVASVPRALPSRFGPLRRLHPLPTARTDKRVCRHVEDVGFAPVGEQVPELARAAELIVAHDERVRQRLRAIDQVGRDLPRRLELHIVAGPRSRPVSAG